MIRSKFIPLGKKFAKSIWFFPSIMTALLVLLTIFQINGSSIGIYHQMFYGDTNDPYLIANEPRSIRSDEWIVNSQKTIGQYNNDFAPFNTNQGEGEDVIIISDSPANHWSTVFKPQNIAFFVMPFDYAFAFKWWFLSYAVVLSAYFFLLVFMPKRKLLASLLSLAFLMSPFLGWWYTTGTLMPVAWGLLGFVFFTKIIHSKTYRSSLLWSSLLAYAGVCFALTMYVPFQIPIAIALLILCVGYLLDNRQVLKKKELLRILSSIGLSLVLIGSVVILLFSTHKNTINTIQSTAYPGQRVVKSGGYDKSYLLSSQLGGLLQNNERAARYSLPSIGATNQSSLSNFMLIGIFLIPPLVFLLVKNRRKPSYIALGLLATGLLFSAWLFIPGLDLLGKITLLDKVPHQRLLIGIGILNLATVAVFIKLYAESKWKPKIQSSIIYALVCVILLLIINFIHVVKFPEFIGIKGAVLLALPFPAIVYLLLRRRFVVAATVLVLFCALSVFKIQPIYHSTKVLSKTPLSTAMKEVASQHNPDGRWISEDIYIENFATMNGLPSITGTYMYPQLSIWDKLDSNAADEDIYNRFAHTNFTFDRDADRFNKPILSNPGYDQLNIRMEPCDSFLKSAKISYLISSREFDQQQANCLTHVRSVQYPTVSFHIYLVRL